MLFGRRNKLKHAKLDVYYENSKLEIVDNIKGTG